MKVYVFLQNILLSEYVYRYDMWSYVTLEKAILIFLENISKAPLFNLSYKKDKQRPFPTGKMDN